MDKMHTLGEAFERAIGISQKKRDLLNNECVYPRLEWVMCPQCISEKRLKIEVVEKSQGACKRHGGVVTFSVIRRGDLFYLQEASASHPVHSAEVYRWLAAKKPEADVISFMLMRHVHHVNQNTLDNRIENLLPVLSAIHFGIAHWKSVSVEALWGIDRDLTKSFAKHGLIDSDWHPDMPAARLANIKAKEVK